ncbi:NADPH:adrenodoxin oxidoreductase, mitochondrial-like protein [Drosera capensis]
MLPKMAALHAAKRLLRTFSSSVASKPLRVCIVGSGPAGFYTAEKMLKAHPTAEVDVLDRLPTPFGLVRAGVAPDHPETKVVLAYGAESDRVLGIPGEDLGGIYSAREFVWWYNGHPDGRKLAPDLQSTDAALILGQGNVALDVARILLRSTVELATTDISSHAMAALEGSCIRKVYLVGRRGPVQAACTAKELREILGTKGLSVHIQESDLQTTAADEEEMKNNRIRRRVYELLTKAASSSSLNRVTDECELHFIFLRRPVKFLNSETKRGHIASVRLEKTNLKESMEGKQIAIGTGEFEDINCGLVLKSIGYKSIPVDGLPFDPQKGVVPNIGGRVLHSEGDQAVLSGLYVCGWLKRGPTGIIATNLYCAEETVASITEDLQSGELATASTSPKPGREGLLQLLDGRSVKVVPFSAWEKIDSEEKRRGSLKNKPREKLSSWEELLNFASH